MKRLRGVLSLAAAIVILSPCAATAQNLNNAADQNLVKVDDQKVDDDTVKVRRKRAVKATAGSKTETDSPAPAPDYEDLRSVNEATMVGFGAFRMKDSYLSQMEYNGYGFRYANERMKLMKANNYKYSCQSIVNVDISSALNGAENANFLSAFVDYAYGIHYRFLPDPFFKILTGASARGMLGMVYNTRNGNNPMTLHADIDLNLSVMAIYEFKIRKHPLAVRYQFEIPFVGVMFSPEYKQSYYEIFSLGNTAEIFRMNSLNNKFAMRNYLYLDFPISGWTIRVGYFGQVYSTNVSGIDRYILSHNLMVGCVKEFIALGGRELRRRNLFISAYY